MRPRQKAADNVYQLDNNDMKMWAEPSYTPDQWLKYAIDNLEWSLAEGEHEVGAVDRLHQARLAFGLGCHILDIGLVALWFALLAALSVYLLWRPAR